MNDRCLLVLGTHNRKKGLELQRLLAPHGFRLQTLADFPQAIQVAENGRTFAENARLKACQQARHLGLWVLGEDSGLAVDVLDGRPGVYSARFAGPNATDPLNNQRLLEELENVPLEQRSAHYCCHVVLADPVGQVRLECDGRCHGRIRPAPLGDSGFGYDPLFEIVEYHRTFGQLGDTVKSMISHRGRALRQLLPALLKLVAEGEWERV